MIPYIQTGYETGLNALPVRTRSVFTPVEATFSYSLAHFIPKLSFLSLNALSRVAL